MAELLNLYPEGTETKQLTKTRCSGIAVPEEAILLNVMANYMATHNPQYHRTGALATVAM